LPSRLTASKQLASSDAISHVYLTFMPATAARWRPCLRSLLTMCWHGS
jgi:hypothetical protein